MARLPHLRVRGRGKLRKATMMIAPRILAIIMALERIA